MCLWLPVQLFIITVVLFYFHFLRLKKVESPEIVRQSRMKRGMLAFFCLFVYVCVCGLFPVVYCCCCFCCCFILHPFPLDWKSGIRRNCETIKKAKGVVVGFFVCLFVYVCVWGFCWVVYYYYYCCFLLTEKVESRDIVRQSRMKCTSSKECLERYYIQC